MVLVAMADGYLDLETLNYFQFDQGPEGEPSVAILKVIGDGSRQIVEYYQGQACDRVRETLAEVHEAAQTARRHRIMAGGYEIVGVRP